MAKNPTCPVAGCDGDIEVTTLVRRSRSARLRVRDGRIQIITGGEYDAHEGTRPYCLVHELEIPHNGGTWWIEEPRPTKSERKRRRRSRRAATPAPAA